MSEDLLRVTQVVTTASIDIITDTFSVSATASTNIDPNSISCFHTALARSDIECGAICGHYEECKAYSLDVTLRLCVIFNTTEQGNDYSRE